MKILRNILLTIALTLSFALLEPAQVFGEEDYSTFALTGMVTNVWCLTGPEPPTQPCYVEVEVLIDNNETRTGSFWCQGDLADICEALPGGLRILVIGRDTITEKRAIYIGMLLEPTN